MKKNEDKKIKRRIMIIKIFGLTKSEHYFLHISHYCPYIIDIPLSSTSS